MKLIPTSRRDRQNLLIGIVSLLFNLLISGTLTKTSFGRILLVICVLSAVTIFVSVYFFPDKTNSAEGTEYAQMVAQLDETQNVLKTMSAFLERERLRINLAEQAVSRLQEERVALEPVVKTQRETVEAILRVHASTVRAYAWKDRLMGFGIGVLSSMVAWAILYAFGVGR